MPNSKFLTSEFMVLDVKTKDKRGRGPGAGGRRNHPAEHHPTPQQQQQREQQPQPDMTRPLGPGMAHSMWGEELQRQRIMSASRLVFHHCVQSQHASWAAMLMLP